MSDEKKRVHSHDLARQGGPWLGAARGWLQTRKCFGNGEHVTWGSDTVIEPHITARQVEELAAEVAAAAFNEQGDREMAIERLRKKVFDLSVKLDAFARIAEEHVRNCEVYGPLSDPSNGSLKRLQRAVAEFFK